ncbi:serine/threonine-protein kinase [Nocardia sp. NPDC127526]|uniref:serine/threonine-protein kinase n=1 Tax=Nocardia sp. NPDC127526 TaxID=3345393 RepID=UPI00364109E0
MTIGPGAVVGGYRIERVLGAGGMGTVYLAKHPSLPRWDALKVLSAQLSTDQEFRGRFEREANLAAALDHPNIVAVHNRGEDHGQLWIAMQYVDGIDASEAMKRDPRSMTPHRALRIVTEVGRGLDHAHRRGLLHRDVKPANFMLSAVDGDDERVLLADFGLAKDTEDSTELTQTGTFVATVAYAAPEQLSGDPVDRHTDIYSLGCSFYKLLTGQNPYPATQPALVMTGHLFEPPPRITAVRPDLPQALDEVIAVAMAKNPAERFDTCYEFTQALDMALNQGVSMLSMRTQRGMPTAAPVSQRQRTTQEQPPPPAKSPVAKGRWIAAGAAAVAVALAVGIGLWAVNSGGGADVAVPMTTTVAPASTPKTLAEAREQNPQFAGKSIAAVDITGESGYLAELAIHLRPSAQATFFEALGFVYHVACVRKGDEPTPRPVDKSYTADPSPLTQVDSGYLLAVRSDAQAGKGGMVNLPSQVSSRKATVLVLDDPAAVIALREWSDSSEQILLEKLLPILRKSVK